MVALNFNSLCKEAELYYYDFLCREDRKAVPEFITDHIKQCRQCQGQLNQLAHVLSMAEGHIEPWQKQVDSAVNMMLKLHFAYVGKTVTCQTARPFLPTLLDHALEIGIPTPITAHLDNCKECSEDLETIRMLNLSRKQLRQLSQLFTDKSAGSSISCADAQNAIPSVVSMMFSEIDSEVLKHICACPDCRELLYQRREMVLRGLQKTSLVKDKFPCEKVSARDFFDYAVPYEIDPVNDQYAKFRESLTSHLRTCPTCLVKMQELHKTIYGICERPESEVVTVYHVDESAKAQAREPSNIPYAGFPVRVDISRREEVKDDSLLPAVNFDAALRRKAWVTNLKPLFKSALAAAAVISIVALLLLNAPVAKAVTLSQIYKAVEGIKNVYVAKFAPDKTKPIQEIWASQTLRIYVTKTGEELTLWDIRNGVVKMKRPDAREVETTQLSVENIADIESKVNGHLGLVPFTQMSEIPADAQWSRVIDNSLEAASGETEIYDLVWPEASCGNSVVFKKWRFFVNPQTNLPRRTEFSEKLSTDNDYVLESMNIIEYLGDTDAQLVLKQVSF
jgi:hypothetical protein